MSRFGGVVGSVLDALAVPFRWWANHHCAICTGWIRRDQVSVPSRYGRVHYSCSPYGISYRRVQEDE